MQELRANTQVIVPIGPFVDVGDGFTPETGITLGAADEAELLKHGSTTVTDIAAATWAAITGMDGYYGLTLTTSHTDTEGMLTVVVQDDSVCLPVVAKFMVLSEAAYDSKYVAKDDGFMDVNIKTIGRADTQETEATNLEAACAAYSATRGLSGTALPAAAADAAGGLIISDAGGLDVDAQLVTKINSILDDTGTAGVVVASIATGAITAAAIATDAIDADALAADAIAEINATVDTALADIRLDELLAADSDIDGAAPPTVGSVFHELMSATAGSFTFDQTTDSLEAVRDRGDAAWITATSVTVSDKTGFSLVSTGLDAVTAWTVDITGDITGNLSGSVGSVTGAVGSVTGNVGGNVTGSVGSLAAQAKADVNAEVVDALATDTYAEPTGVPGATVTLSTKLGYLYMALRNQIDVTATKKTFYDDGGAAEWEKDLSDNGTTYSESEGNAI